MYLTENFEPRRVLERFEDICAIPHGSGHEQALGDWVMALAEKRGHEAIRDAAGNILVRVAASPGCEAAPPILLQGHLDMVLAQEEGLGRDMIREPVHLVLEGSILRADRTTLGADNAVGLCHMLALMDADDLRHPPMELLFTVCEEEGLQGIQAFDLSQLRARRMINMDMGDPDCMVIGSAGSAKLTVSRPCRHASCHDAGLEISISGLRGGHSGLLAGKNHISALHLAGRVLGKLCDVQPVRLIQLESDGGSGIPRSALLRVAVPDKDAAMTLLRDMAQSLTDELREETGFSMSAAETACEAAASAGDTRALADFLVLVPYDVTIRSTLHPEWVLSSALLMAARYEMGRFSGLLSIRANRDEYFEGTMLRISTLCRMTGVTAAMQGKWIPAWPESTDTPLQTACRDTFHALFHREMQQEVEHGTVEVSVIAKAIPDMDIVGFAPKSRGAHTPQEHLYLDTMEPFWKHLTALLASLCEG